MNLLKSLVKSVAGPTKMVLVVRSDLGLRKGKIASQCAHAAVMCYMRSASANEPMLKLWLVQGQPKIVVKVDDLQEMERIAELARERKVVAEIVRDAGRTQVQSGTETVLGLGPESADVIDSLAGHLKLM
uniref:peptidyl-tRNA hydrolase n=1 Tax=Culex tarsalis TaxID=7177 RepID=A0A1Q3FK75_CULTA